MKPLTKTVAIRRGGLAAQIEKAEPAELEFIPAKQPNRPWKAGDVLGTLKPKYDRNEAHRAYMREYMRKRRAADKAKRERE